MASLRDVVLQYRELCAYCDSFFVRVQRKHASDMACRRGCTGCCVLETACALESYALRQYMKRTDIVPVKAEQTCPLLKDGACLVYPVRPIICRTHGCAIQMPDGGGRDCCPLNFKPPRLADLEQDDVLDITRITHNLMRLNLAFCMLLGNRELSGKRLRLTDVVSGALPPTLLGVEHG